MPLTEESLDGPPPDPLVLFTVLYGTYPCNFTAFLRDPVGYLRGKGWHGPSGDGDIALDSVAVKDRSTVRPPSLSLSRMKALPLPPDSIADDSALASNPEAHAPPVPLYFGPRPRVDRHEPLAPARSGGRYG